MYIVKRYLAKIYSTNTYTVYTTKKYRKRTLQKTCLQQRLSHKIRQNVTSTTCVYPTQHVTYTYTRNNYINKQNPHTDDENVYKKCIQKNVHTTKVYAEKGKQQKVYHRNLMYTLS